VTPRSRVRHGRPAVAHAGRRKIREWSAELARFVEELRAIGRPPEVAAKVTL